MYFQVYVPVGASPDGAVVDTSTVFSKPNVPYVQVRVVDSGSSSPDEVLPQRQGKS